MNTIHVEIIFDSSGYIPRKSTKSAIRSKFNPKPTPLTIYIAAASIPAFFFFAALRNMVFLPTTQLTNVARIKAITVEMKMFKPRGSLKSQNDTHSTRAAHKPIRK